MQFGLYADMRTVRGVRGGEYAMMVDTSQSVKPRPEFTLDSADGISVFSSLSGHTVDIYPSGILAGPHAATRSGRPGVPLALATRQPALLQHV